MEIIHGIAYNIDRRLKEGLEPTTEQPELIVRISNVLYHHLDRKHSTST